MEPDRTGEIVKRALAYPHAVPGRSFLLERGKAAALPGGAPVEPAGPPRTALLAYGSNAAPAALARKLAPLCDVPLPVVGAELRGFDVVYSAHVSPRGSVPGTLHRSAATTVRVALLLPTAEQLGLLSATEPNYELTTLVDLELSPDEPVGATAEVAVYLSRHGPLSLGGHAVALAEVEARGRSLNQLTQPEVLELVRAELRPDLSLDAFILAAVEAGGIAAFPEFGPP